MFDRFSSAHFFIIRVLLGISFLVLSACAPATTAGASSPLLIGCPTTSKNSNPFFSHQQSPYITKIFSAYRNGWINARQDALMQLGKNMNLWSDYRNFVSGDGQIVRITITYLDPVLIQYLILNNVLSLPREISTSMDINFRIQREMTNFEQHDMLLFVVVIASSTTGVQANNEQALYLDVPLNKLLLTHPSGRQTKPSYIDNILTEKIDLAQGPVHGIVGYPVSVIVQENCIGFLGNWTSSLTLDLDESLHIGEKSFDSLFWNIPFQPLMIQDDNHPDPPYDPNYETRLSKLGNPPLPDLRAKTGLDETTTRLYWEDMGRYLWNYLIGESGH